MIKQIVLLILIFYFLTLLQSSFLVHFTLFWGMLNFIFIAVILLNIFTSDIKLGISAAVIAGFFLDIFSENFFGFWFLILLTLSCFIKFVLEKYVQLPKFGNFS